MKKIHSFDEVFDGQKVFRIVLEAMSNPGRMLSINEYAEKLFGNNKLFLALAMTLLDNEVTFCTCGNEELAEDISLLTLSKRAAIENANFIFVEESRILESVFEKAMCGTLENPHCSATIIVKVKDEATASLNIYGAGIDGVAQIFVDDTVNKVLDLRDEQEYEYPQGTDIIFVTEKGRLFSIPRLVLREGK